MIGPEDGWPLALPGRMAFAGLLPCNGRGVSRSAERIIWAPHQVSWLQHVLDLAHEQLCEVAPMLSQFSILVIGVSCCVSAFA